MKRYAKILQLLPLLGLCLAEGCFTVVPQTTRSHVPSLDHNAANSGFLFFNADGSGTFTEGAYQRFCWLRDHYGSQLRPPLTDNRGLTPGPVPGTWIFDAERIDDFQKLTYLANNPKATTK